MQTYQQLESDAAKWNSAIFRHKKKKNIAPIQKLQKNFMHLLYHPNQQQPPVENFWQEGCYSHQGLIT